MINISKEERELILNSYKWIKVKKFTDNKDLSWEERFKLLEKHHVEETKFLIDKIRSILSDPPMEIDFEHDEDFPMDKYFEADEGYWPDDNWSDFPY